MDDRLERQGGNVRGHLRRARDPQPVDRLGPVDELIEGNCPRGSAAHKGVIGEIADPSEIAATVVFSD